MSIMSPEKCAENIVMTGGTSGIGAHVLDRLMTEARPCHVFLMARKSGPATETWRRHRNTGRLTVVWVDLADLGAVSRGCDELLDRLGGREIHVLALNAGMLAIGRRQPTVDGLEFTFAVNHLAHVLLVERLKREIARGGRIIITSSEVHDPKAFCLVGIERARWQEPSELADPEKSQCHITDPRKRGEARYSASKLLNVMHARYLARRMPAIAVAAFNPSVVPGTGIARERRWWARGGWTYVLPVLSPLVPGMRSIARSSSDLLWLLRDAPAEQVSGQYVNGREVMRGSDESHDRVKIDSLMEFSLDLLTRLGHLVSPEKTGNVVEMRKI